MPSADLKYTSVSLMLLTQPIIGSVTTLTSQQMFIQGCMAESWLDAKLAKRFTFPLVGGPFPLLETIATNLGLYFILRRLFSKERMNENNWVDSYKDDSIEICDMLLKGEIALVDASGTVIQSPVDQVFSDKSQFIPTFDEIPLTLQEIDDDKTDARLRERDQNFDFLVDQ